MTQAFQQVAKTLLGVTLFFSGPILTHLYIYESKVNVEMYYWPIFDSMLTVMPYLKILKMWTWNDIIYFPGLVDDGVVEAETSTTKLL